MRLINDSEIKETAWIMAENFSDYPLYDVFFENDEKKTKRIFYFFWYRMYTRKNFSYVTEEKDLVVSFQRPEDKIRSPIGLLLNPVFLFGFLKNVPFSSIRLVSEYGKLEKPYLDKYYNPRTDCYAQAVCVLKKSRGNGAVIKVFKELDDGRPIFCETHTEENVKLYEYLGAQLCETAKWHGVTHYVMKKRGEYII